jgi:hypothetical protein
MKYAEIKNGKVTNIVIAEPDVAAERGWIECPYEAGVGWDYDGLTFVDNRPEPVTPTQPVAPTAEQLLAELQVLTAKINALE